MPGDSGRNKERKRKRDSEDASPVLRRTHFKPDPDAPAGGAEVTNFANVRIKPDPDAPLPSSDSEEEMESIEPHVQQHRDREYRASSPMIATVAVDTNHCANTRIKPDPDAPLPSSDSVEEMESLEPEVQPYREYRPSSPTATVAVDTDDCANTRIIPDPDAPLLAFVSDSVKEIESLEPHVQPHREYRPSSPTGTLVANTRIIPDPDAPLLASNIVEEMESLEPNVQPHQEYRPSSPNAIVAVGLNDCANTRIKPDPDAPLLASDSVEAMDSIEPYVQPHREYRPSSPTTTTDVDAINCANTRIKPDPDASLPSSGRKDEIESREPHVEPNREYRPSSPTATAVVGAINCANTRIKLDPDASLPSSDSKGGIESTKPHVQRHREYRAPSPKATVDDDAIGCPNTGFKPDPYATLPLTGNVEEEYKAPKFDYMENDERPVISNVFHFSTKPLPHVESVRKGDMDAGGGPINPQVPHYRNHTETEEVEYAASGPSQHISYHNGESDDEMENTDSTPHLFEKGQRYFKQKGVGQRYNFHCFKFPEVKNLAVYQYKDKILQEVLKHHVVVIEGFTGCGKTTQVPQFILDYCVEKELACNIVVTQPRRLATISVARRVCSERGWNMGGIVGYKVGLDRSHNEQEAMVTYMTTGVLLHTLITTRSLKKFTHIIIDEVHERDLESDFLLLIIKKILMEDKAGHERHVKIILMSATLNALKFSKYFSIQRQKDGVIEQAPIIKIPLAQAKYLVLESFLEDLMDQGDMKELEFNREKATLHSSLYDAAVKTIISLDGLDRASESGSTSDPRCRSQNYTHVKPDHRGSVLVFLPGLAEIDTLLKRLQAENNKQEATTSSSNFHKWNIIPLHSTITTEEQGKAFLPVQKGHRKIILSTNIAESSITVPDIVYVIDFCLTKSVDTDPRTNFSCLRTVWASLSQCIQRKGRTGRVAKGQVFRLVPKDFYSSMEKDTIPEMLRGGLEKVIVRVKKFAFGSPKDLLSFAIDAPMLSGIERAVVNLKELGGLTLLVTKENNERVYDTCDGDLTYLGDMMSILPVAHQCVRLILLGQVFGVMNECIIIAAGLSVKSPFGTPYGARLDAYLAKMDWSKKSYSDCIAILNLYREWSMKYDGGRSDVERRWAKMTFAQVSGLREMRNQIDDLRNRLEKMKIVPFPFQFGNVTTDPDVLSKEQLGMVKVAIAGAFYPNYFHRQRPGSGYEREKLREIMGGNLFNTVYFRGFPGGHCGTLYGGIVAEDMAFGAGVPNVKFDGQKVLVAFDSSADTIGPINQSVYRAVKRRQLRQRLEFNLLPREQETAYYATQERNLRANSSLYNPCPPQIDLPPISVAEFFMVVTHVESPSQFWVVYSAHEAKLNEMSEAINRNMQQPIRLRSEKIGPGALCLAPWTDEDGVVTCLYYRARIRSVSPGKLKALVYFVDYGNSQWINTAQLLDFNRGHIEANVLTQKCLAVECRLACLKPSVLYGSVWHDTATRNLKMFVKVNRLKIKIYCVVKSVIAGVLYGVVRKNDKEDLMIVNQKLVDEGYAETVQENSDCTANNRVRERYHIIHRNGDTEQITACNSAQIELMNNTTYVVPPRHGTIRLELKGPWSPLELSFQSLCHSSNSKEVGIDDNSVNSVALDQEPAAPTSRLVVASAVTIQDRTGRVVARDTTMMPALPGLMSIMAMTFAPRIELRVDRHKTYYTGVLCGLGIDPNSGAAIYQDHDMEIIFDTTIEDSDIITINKIRHYMNIILQGDRNVDSTPAQKQVVKEMFGLMMKKRKPLLEEVWPQDTYSWNKIPPESIVPPAAETIATSLLDIFPLHSTVALENTYAPEVSWNDYAI